MMHTILAFIALGVGTVVFGGSVLVAQLFRVPFRRNGIYQLAPRWWARGLLRAAGVKVVVHNGERLQHDRPSVYIANHVSWYDIPVLINVLPHYGFLAKRELERIPLFGAAVRGIGVIYIDRENRKSAFDSIEDAAKKIQAGSSVVVYPEGTRGSDYALRPFKKGSFVLAIRSGAPIVPVVIHGTIHVNPRGSWRARPGTVNVHILEPVLTAGLTYDERNILASTVQSRMAQVLRETYGVEPAIESNNVQAAPLRADEVPA